MIESINLLREALSASPLGDEEAMSLLHKLESCGRLSLAVLQSTLIGKSVNSLRKSTKNKRIQRKAKSILSLWKADVVSSVEDIGQTPPAKRLRAQGLADPLDDDTPLKALNLNTNS